MLRKVTNIVANELCEKKKRLFKLHQKHMHAHTHTQTCTHTHTHARTHACTHTHTHTHGYTPSSIFPQTPTGDALEPWYKGCE